MNGNNAITLCPAEMYKALQLYFDTVLFREGQAPEVVSITQDTQGGSVFRVQVKEREADAAGK